MQVHAKFDVPQAFVVAGDDITKIWKILEDAGLETLATANCSDGLVLHFDECEPLARYDNPKRAAIESLEFSARNTEPYSTAEISLGARYSATISVSFRGDEALVSTMRTGITDVIDGMRPWYSRISTVDLFNVWFPIIAVAMLFIQIMAPSNTPTPALPIAKALSILLVLIGLVGVIFFVVWATAWLRNRFFPAATFAIGQGMGRHQYSEKIRWVVIVGFVINVVASIVATILFAA